MKQVLVIERPASDTRYRFLILFLVILLSLFGFIYAKHVGAMTTWSVERMTMMSGILFDNEVLSTRNISIWASRTPFRLKDPEESLTILPAGTTQIDPRRSDHPWNAYLTSVADQQGCNSCWAFAIAGMLRDRLGIYSEESVKVLSPQSLLDYAEDTRRRVNGCSQFDKCQCGESPSYAMHMAREYGLASEECVGYRAMRAKYNLCSEPNCFYPDRFDGYDCEKMHTFTEVYAIMTEADAFEEIRLNGPVMGVVAICDAFTGVPKGDDYILDPPHIKDSQISGYHAIVVAGAGVSDGVPYWLIRNSWGKLWGNRGYCKLKRGTNALRIGSTFPFYAGIFVSPPGIKFHV